MNVSWGYVLIPGRLWATEERINHLHLDCMLTHNIDIWPCESDIGRGEAEADRGGPGDRSFLWGPLVCLCVFAHIHACG